MDKTIQELTAEILGKEWVDDVNIILNSVKAHCRTHRCKVTQSITDSDQIAIVIDEGVISIDFDTDIRYEIRIEIFKLLPDEANIHYRTYMEIGINPETPYSLMCGLKDVTSMYKYRSLYSLTYAMFNRKYRDDLEFDKWLGACVLTIHDQMQKGSGEVK